MKSNKIYNIGLDIGVASVGWCVTDENNNILKRNGRNMWGSRIFEEAKTASGRRALRSARRRLDRRKMRIHILQDLLRDDIEKAYPNFFPMLKEASLSEEDKLTAARILGKKHNLFSEENNTDTNYYDKFPTIYHLRKELIENSEKMDIRLVYLAIHHIIKYRGNFLYEGDFSNNLDIINESIDNIVKFLENSYDVHIKSSISEIVKILSDKLVRKADKKDKIIELFDFDKEDKKLVTHIVNAILGYKFEIKAIFEEVEDKKISFSNEIDKEEDLIVELKDQAFIYESLKDIYSWYILQDMLNNENYISNAFVKKYKEYQSDLVLLKKVYKEFLQEKYNKMFREVSRNNYVAYNGKSNGVTNKKCTIEDIYATIKKDFSEINDNILEKTIVLTKIENNEFLKKLNNVENGAIPNQLHKKELEIILDNQAKYYKSIAENKDKIMSLLTFRIPYYVGPLAKNDEMSNWSWIVRRSNEKIRPWNFDDVVDKDETAEKFIRRMTNKCTYLIGEDVMPKQSIVYSKYCVFNEINNLRINERKVAKDMKAKIYNEIFLIKKKVTVDDIKKLYNKNGFEINTITGLSDGKNFNSNMIAYIDMKKIIGEITEENIELCEKIIYWITIFEDKSILKKKLQDLNVFDNGQIKQLSKLKYTGWSRLSAKLINGITSIDNGETILEKLENTSENFMQIINNKKYGFDKKIESYMPKEQKKLKYADVDELQTSPTNKRAIWQTILVVDEIKKVMGCEPKNIYIEFARGDESNPKLKSKRAKNLLEKYEGVEDLKKNNKALYNELKAHQSDKEFSDRLYLYFTQMGKCLYSGKPLDIDRLSEYQIDHIIPQSYIKDDSLDNKALVYSIENQRKSDSLLLEDSIQKKMRIWWEYLLSANLITQTKFYRLTKNKMFETTDDKVKFVERQLVETRQIIKHVTNLFSNQYSNSKILALRAELTGHFRNKYEIFKNRDVNDCHHAQDAYIISTIGNIMDKHWRKTDEFEYGKYINNYVRSKEFSSEKHSIVMGMVGKYVDIHSVKKCMNYKDYFISRMLEEQTGEFYGQTLISPKDKPSISLKNNLRADVYGGYTGEQKAYYCIYQYKDKKDKLLCRLIGVPIKIATDIKNKRVTLEEYIVSLAESRNEKFVKIIFKKIMKNQEYIDEMGNLMMFRSDSEIKCAKQLILNNELNTIIHYLNMSQVCKISEKYGDVYELLFDELLKKIKKEYLCFYSKYEVLLGKKETFLKLDDEKRIFVLNQIIQLMSNTSSNLKHLGLSERYGRIKDQQFGDKRLRGMTFVDKSVTGMYEKRVKIWDGE